MAIKHEMFDFYRTSSVSLGGDIHNNTFFPFSAACFLLCQVIRI